MGDWFNWRLLGYIPHLPHNSLISLNSIIAIHLLPAVALIATRHVTSSPILFALSSILPP